jgi:hypothetical protein
VDAETLTACRCWLSALLRHGRKDLTPDELSLMLPPRGPSGSLQNRVRGTTIRTLNRAGFTFRGRRLS